MTRDQDIQERRYGGRFQRSIVAHRAAHLSGVHLANGSAELEQLDSVDELRLLAVPPGNQLEALKGDRKGQHSVRVNDQYRVVFTWTSLGAEDVEIVDYH